MRKILQTEPRIILLASATSRFDEIGSPDHALYDLFRILLLHPLDTNECAVLWESVSGKCPPPDTIRSLEILTGGSPRLITIVARFGAGRSFPELMADLLDLVDDHTEYFKSQIESFPPQERRVYLALAELWKPATTKEDRGPRPAGDEQVQCPTHPPHREGRRSGHRWYCSAQTVLPSRAPLQHLLLTAALPRTGILWSRPSSNSWSRTTLELELRDIGARIAREAGSFGGEMKSLAQIALARLIEVPVLARHREELLAMNEQAEFLAAKEIFDEAVALKNQDRPEEALSAFDEVVRRFAESEMPKVSRLVAMALFEKGLTLNELDWLEDALVAYDEVVRRFGDSETPVLSGSVALALFGKGCVLNDLDQPEDALVAYDEVVHRFGDSETPVLSESVALALFGKGCVLNDLDQPEDALVAYDEVVHRFGDSETPVLLGLSCTGACQQRSHTWHAESSRGRVGRL